MKIDLKRAVEVLEACGYECDELKEHFVSEISKQTPEKPDHWASCSQCEHNSGEAEDIVEALAATEQREIPE